MDLDDLFCYEDLQIWGFCFIPAKGQSLEAPDQVTGNFGEPLTLKWTLVKKEETDKVQSSILFFGKEVTGATLFTGSTAGVQEEDSAKELFGGRISASWIGLTYVVTVANLQYNDTVSFTLFIIQRAAIVTEKRPDVNKTITISAVNGTYFV